MAGQANPRMPNGNTQDQRFCVPQPLPPIPTTWDVSRWYNATITLTGNITFPLPVGLYRGASGMLTVNQDSVGGRTIVWAAGYRGAYGAKPSLTATGNAIDEIAWYSPDGIHVDLSPTPAVA